MERLVFVRQLHQLGIEQSRQPEPLNVVAVLLLHDCVEFFLQLAADRTNATVEKKRADFMDLVNAVNAALKVAGKDPLGYDMPLKQLNGARVGLKHQGIHPSEYLVTSISATITSFLEHPPGLRDPLRRDLDGAPRHRSSHPEASGAG